MCLIPGTQGGGGGLLITDIIGIFAEEIWKFMIWTGRIAFPS